MIFFFTRDNLIHTIVKGKGFGASEYQFYNLIDTLQKLYKIFVFNCIQHKQLIENVEYDNIDNLKNVDETYISCFIQQRSYHLLTYPNKYNLSELFPSTYIFLWCHDLPEDIIFGMQNDTIDIRKSKIRKLIENNNIKFIFVSNYCYNSYYNYFMAYNFILNHDKYIIIYNNIYDYEIINNIKINNIKYLFDTNFKYLLYSSAAQKGLDTIIDILTPVLESTDNYKLVICNPSYSVYNKSNKLKDKIILLKNLDKFDYYSVLNSVQFIIAPPFKETFGCAFNEAECFGIPVIFFENCGAIKEICNNDCLTQFNSNSIMNIINNYIKKNIYPPVFLNHDTIINKWLNLVNEHEKLDIEIGYLSWKSHITLRNTLKSHKYNNLLTLLKYKNIFFQEISQYDKEISMDYNLNILGSDINIGILDAFLILINQSKGKYFIFCENDFELIHDINTTKQVLNDCINLIENYNINIVKLRDRNNPGIPLYSRPKIKDGENIEDIIYEDTYPYQLESVHWLQNPEKIFKNTLKKVSLNYDWFITNEKSNIWSNNIFIAKTNWLKENVINIIEKYKNNDDNRKFQQLEEILIKYLKFNIAGGPGLFTHNRID